MTTEPGAPPAIFLHTELVYKTMAEQATRELVGEGQWGIVYSGHMTKLIMGPPLNLPIPYYTQIRNALIGMGCATQLKRGGGTSPSRWMLFKPPTLELYQKWDEAATNSATKARSKTAQVEQMVRDLTNRVESLESAFEEFLSAVGE